MEHTVLSIIYIHKCFSYIKLLCFAVFFSPREIYDKSNSSEKPSLPGEEQTSKDSRYSFFTCMDVMLLLIFEFQIIVCSF